MRVDFCVRSQKWIFVKGTGYATKLTTKYVCKQIPPAQEIYSNETSCNASSNSPCKQTENDFNPISCCGGHYYDWKRNKNWKKEVDLIQDGSLQLQGMDPYHPPPLPWFRDVSLCTCHGLNDHHASESDADGAVVASGIVAWLQITSTSEWT